MESVSVTTVQVGKVGCATFLGAQDSSSLTAVVEVGVTAPPTGAPVILGGQDWAVSLLTVLVILTVMIRVSVMTPPVLPTAGAVKVGLAMHVISHVCMALRTLLEVIAVSVMQAGWGSTVMLSALSMGR